MVEGIRDLVWWHQESFGVFVVFIFILNPLAYLELSNLAAKQKTLILTYYGTTVSFSKLCITY